MRSLEAKRQLRVLDFDIENRPLSYLGSDYTTAEVTAIAASFTDERKVHVWLLGEHSLEEMLTGFLALYDAADIVTGHYILKHDLPILTDQLAELSLGSLGRKLASDTKLHLRLGKGISKSQENLSEMLGVRAPKVQMNQVKWREANRLTKKGLKLTRERVVGDIKQHKELRKELLKRDLLGPPELWEP